MIINKKILILGGTGSLGHALTKRYIDNNEIFIFSRGEKNQWLMGKKYKDLNFHIGDIRDKERVESCIIRSKPNIIIIAAALKHIDICKKNTHECINTNIDGIKNVIDIITTYSVNNIIPYLESVVFISTDKACSPVNTYGMCKAVSERLVIEKSEFLQKPKFVVVRYGNVLMSNGSLIPLFKEIGENSDKTSFSITNKKMTRFFMTLDSSVDLIEYAILKSESGDTVIPKNINSYKILDIANYFSKKYNKDVFETGIRPGEKFHEDLISFTESTRTIVKDNYYIIKPTYNKKIYNSDTFQFTSLNNVKKLDKIIFNAIDN